MRQTFYWVYLYSTAAVRKEWEKHKHQGREVGAWGGSPGAGTEIPLQSMEGIMLEQVDDTKLGEVADTSEGCAAIQRDLEDRMEKCLTRTSWSSTRRSVKSCTWIKTPVHSFVRVVLENFKKKKKEKSHIDIFNQFCSSPL